MFNFQLKTYHKLRKEFDCEKAFPHAYEKISKLGRNWDIVTIQMCLNLIEIAKSKQVSFIAYKKSPRKSPFQSEHLAGPCCVGL